MKIETIVTAIIFLSVGFLAGFIYKSQRQASVPSPVVQAAATGAESGSAGAMGMSGGPSVDPATGLPKGHPPLEVAQTIQNYEQQARQNPQDAGIPLQLANYLYDKKYFNLAIEWYERSLKLDANDINARTDLGTCYFYTGQAPQAISEYNKALALDPNHQPTIFNLIVVNLEGAHDLRTANKYWNKLNGQNPNYPGLKEIKEKLDAAMAGPGSAVTP
ncbi:MAG TPA: tetratricopeptide repeat protein [Terriglobia bacterium]|nr:tetratricopeptide repeat protein [Terriglobia bacterium]